MLGLPEDRVVVRYAAIGGAFGGREDLSLQHLLALAAWRLRRPVAMVWSREESILAHHKRHPVRILGGEAPAKPFQHRRELRSLAVLRENVSGGVGDLGMGIEDPLGQRRHDRLFFNGIVSTN